MRIISILLSTLVLAHSAVASKETFDIQKSAQSYVDYLNAIGKAGTVKDVEGAPLLAKECTKIINGGALFKEGAKLLPQLDEALKGVEGWDVKLLNTTVGKIGEAPVRMVSVLYKLTSKKMGSFRTSAFLTYDDTGALTEINEVCEHLG